MNIMNIETREYKSTFSCNC